MALARSSLSASAPSAEALVAALPAAFFVVDAQGCIASANAAAEVMLNVSAAHLRHKPLGMVLRLPPQCIAGLAEDSAFAAYDCTIETARRVRLRVDFHASALPEHPGWRLVMLSGEPVAHAMGQRLDPGGRSAMGAAAMLAHEIKNPLSGIRGAAQLLDAHVDGDGLGLTRLIRDEVDRVVALIDRMEAFTDVRLLERRSENAHPIIEHARAVALAGDGDRVDIVDAYDPSLPHVHVNRDALVQVLLNLIKNAAEASVLGRKSTVLLTTRYRHGIAVADGATRRVLPVEVSVSDDGPGPPDTIVEHLFEPFVSSKAAGRGLGLALVDKLVRDNGGLVQFAREHDRSVFRILLPSAA